MSSSHKIDELIEEYLQRTEAGEKVDEQAFLSRHSEHAEELKSFLQLHHRARSAFSLEDEAVQRDSITPPFSGPFDESPTIPPDAQAPPGRSDSMLDRRPLSGSATGTSYSAWSWSHIAEADFPLAFGPYELLSEINRGGMGVVYRAIHRDLRREVALKVLRAGELATDEEVKRFHTEAVANSALNHPNIIPIYEAGQQHGLFYFTMAFIDGEDLESRLRREPIAPEQLATIMLKVTAAVAHAHNKEVLHRDIKPSNILLDHDEEPFLADFGLAHLIANDDGMTMTGQILGTPAYMPPEQASGRAKELGPAIDIYALGAVLYCGLTRQPPFSGPTPFDVLLQVIDRQPPKPSQIDRNVPADLEAICLKAMSKSPSERYPTAEAMAEDFRRYLRGDAVEISRPDIGKRLQMWWRRETILVSHLVAISAVALIMIFFHWIRPPDLPQNQFELKLALVFLWGFVCVGLQRLTLIRQHKLKTHLAWASTDVVIYTVLMILADSPRGLLLIGYPMMIAASGLFYRVRFVVFTTALCVVSMMLLTALVDDPMNVRRDFVGIFLSGMIVLGLCVITMIRRIRSLSRYCGAE